jgi:tRNA threonylcarbamoyladenosine modification (KEOPS) complex Cgi121 subunit
LDKSINGKEMEEEYLKDVYQYDEINVLVKGFFLLDNDIKKLYNSLKSIHNDINIVIVNANIVFGIEHIFGILKIINEEIKRKEERGIKNFDVEFLLRICYTSQISYAFQLLNDNKTNDFIFILFSKNLTEIKKIYIDLKNYGKEDTSNSLIQISEAKKLNILRLFFNKDLKDLGNLSIINDDLKFQNFLIERSSIVLK